MKNEVINYAGKDYSITKIENSNLYQCECENATYKISGEELKVIKEMTVKIGNKGTKKEELVSFYNDMITFNPYQYKPYLRLISKENKKKCVYIADEVGVGKTFETGIIISELLYSGRIDIHEPILIVCPNMLCRKWQEVLNTFFGLSSSLIKNLYNIVGISIISFNNISRLKNEEIPSNVKFGVLIVDEAHNVGERFDKLLKLRKQSTFKVLLSATPLSGKNNDECKQKELLFDSDDTTENLFRNESTYFNRTLKEEMREGEVKWNIENRNIKNLNLMAYVDIIDDIFGGRNTLKKFVGLNMISSSPAAAEAYCKYLLDLDDERVKELFVSSKLKKEDYEDLGYDTVEELLNDYCNLEDMQEFFDNIGEEVSEDTISNVLGKISKLSENINVDDVLQDKKLAELKQIIISRQAIVKLGGDDSSYYKKLVVFVNYNETAKYLNENIDNSILINGSIGTDEKLSRFKEFKNMNSGKDVLIITNVACEGLDMDFCNAIVNYDLTYNPVQLAQRKGRIDRFEITCKEKYIYNFLNEGVDPTNYDINNYVNLFQNMIFLKKSSKEDLVKYLNENKETNEIKCINGKTNSIYPILLKKLLAIKIETGIYYNVIDDFGKTCKSDDVKNDAKKKSIRDINHLFYPFFDGENFIEETSTDKVKESYKKVHEDRYNIVNKLLKEKSVILEQKSGDENKILIEIDKNNRDFLKYVYDGGTINSHLIYNK